MWLGGGPSPKSRQSKPGLREIYSVNQVGRGGEVKKSQNMRTSYVYGPFEKVKE